MTLRIVAYDSNSDSAANRAWQLDMIKHPEWLVSAESSRNKLLADIYRSDPNEPICALIDLVHDDRDHLHRRGDRILTTITRHPDLRPRCVPIALTHYAGQLDINEAAWFRRRPRADRQPRATHARAPSLRPRADRRPCGDACPAK